MKSFSAFGAAVLGASLVLQTGASAQTVLAKKGTLVYGVLVTTVDSKTSHNGDKFSLTQKDTWFHKDPLLKGTTIEGHLENVTAAGPTHKASMSIIFDDIRLADGSVEPIHAQVDSLKQFEPQHHLLRDTGVIVGSAVVGHMAASKANVQHGGLAGTAAGFALVSAMKSDIKVKQGTLVKLRMLDNVTAGGAAQ